MRPYAIAILATLCLGGFALAAHVHTRWRSPAVTRFSAVHIGVMVLTVAWSLRVFEPHEVVGGSAVAWLAAVPIGVLLGQLAHWADRRIVRHAARRRLHSADLFRRVQRGALGGAAAYRARVVRRPGGRAPVGAGGADVNSAPERWLRSIRKEPIELPWLVAVAILEELIHRGLLIQLCFLLPAPWQTAAGIAACTVLFAVGHVAFGIAHAAAKLPLSVLAATAALVLGTVAPAVVAHVVFNVRAWRDARRQGRLDLPVPLGLPPVPSPGR